MNINEKIKILESEFKCPYCGTLQSQSVWDSLAWCDTQGIFDAYTFNCFYCRKMYTIDSSNGGIVKKL